MKRRVASYLIGAMVLTGCGCDPSLDVTGVSETESTPVSAPYNKGTGVVGDGNTVDNSQTTSTTYNIDQSQHNDNSTSITTIVDSVIVLRDTILVDSYDTIRVTFQDTIRDTIQHKIQVPVYDTITVLNADTLLLPVIDTLKRQRTVYDTIRDTVYKEITLNAPKIRTSPDDNIIKYETLSDIDLSVTFMKVTYDGNYWDYEIAISDTNKDRKSKTLMYTITYYGYQNNRYVIHYRNNGSLWQSIRTNNGCINIVDVHISDYGIGAVGGPEYLWAVGTSIVCA